MNSDNPETLMEVLRKKIIAGGRITFADFMETVLYHPLYGYYHRQAPKIGKDGDYYTSADVHPIFGYLIAKQIVEFWVLMGRPHPFQLVEMGAGKGLLAHDILQALPSMAPDLVEHLQYYPMEASEYHRRQQQTLLKPWAGIVAWNTWPDLECKGVSGGILSNEWFDALPVHRVRQSADKLREIYVTLREDRFTEVESDLSTPRLSEYFDGLGLTLEPQQMAEINLTALDWLEKISRVLQKGFLLTVDYGFPADELYSPLRPQGTLVCYRRHELSSDPYNHLGEQDMTAHVDFTSLMRHGEAHGLRTLGFTSQKNFLMSLGLTDYLEELDKNEPDRVQQIRTRLAIKNLIVPTGMGEVFKVLLQDKGIDAPVVNNI